MDTEHDLVGTDRRATGPNVLFPARRSKYIFLVRMVALMVTTGALATYALREIAAPTAALLATFFSPPSTITVSQAHSVPTISTLTPDTTAASVPQGTSELSSAQDSTGILNQDAIIHSDDGIAVLRLPKGTKVLDAQGRPQWPASITVTAQELPLRTDIGLVGVAYELGPKGVTVNPSSLLTIGFDAKAYYPFKYQDIDCGHMHIAYYDANAVTTYNNSKGAPIAPWLNVSVDLNSHSVTTSIDHLGIFVLFCEVFGPPIS